MLTVTMLFALFPPTWVMVLVQALALFTPAFSHVFLLRPNHRVSAFISLNADVGSLLKMVVDTGAGPNVIKTSALPPGWSHKLQPIPHLIQAFDANGQPLRFQGIIPLYITIGRCRVKAMFFVCDGLNTDVILGTEFLDRHVKAILPIEGQLVMKDDSSAPLLRNQPHVGASDQNNPPNTGKIHSPKVRCTKSVRLLPETQTWVEVRMAGSGDVIFQQHPPLFTSTGVIPQHAIATVQFNVPFRLLLANFSKNVAELKKSQIVAIATAAPSQVIPSHLTFTQVLGLEPLNNLSQMQSTVDEPASQES